MKIKKLCLAISAGMLLASSTSVLAQEDNAHMLRMVRLDVKVGHTSAFREAMRAYNDCYTENGGESSWSVWSNVTGAGDYYYLVSRMDNYAEMGEQDEASRECWPMAEEQIMPHISQFEARYARFMPDWSGEYSDSTVVELHQFRVEDGREFRETVGEITNILKEADHPHMGAWYRNLHSSSNQPNYFVVSRYADFAAMDEERPSAYRGVADAAGEERADELWDAFGDSLHEDWEYRSELLARIPSLDMNIGED